MGLDSIQYQAQIDRGTGCYGTYQGTILHLTEDHGPIPCGSFSVLLRPGDYFPEVAECKLEKTEDVVPFKRSLFDDAVKILGALAPTHA